MEKEDLRRILTDAKVIAVYGASTNPERTSHIITKHLIEKGYTVYPVNKMYAGKEIGGQEIVASISDVPEKIDILDVFRASAFLPEILPETLAVKPKCVWLQLEIHNEEVEREIKEAGIDLVTDECIHVVHIGLQIKNK